MEVTESSIASAFERFYVTVESGGGDGRGHLLTVRGPVAEPNETAEALFATLSRMAALRDERVVDAHICCEHVLDGGPASDELEVMDKIAVLLRPRSDRAVKRILAWAVDRLTDMGEPPF